MLVIELLSFNFGSARILFFLVCELDASGLCLFEQQASGSRDLATYIYVFDCSADVIDLA